MVTSATSNRDATLDDAATCAALYAAYVEHSAITLETEPPSPQDMAEQDRLGTR